MYIYVYVYMYVYIYIYLYTMLVIVTERRAVGLEGRLRIGQGKARQGRCDAWPGVQDVHITVSLTDFVLGLPHPPNHRPSQNAGLWTEHHPVINASKERCSRLCGHSLDCFDVYPGRHGCYMVVGDRHHWEAEGELEAVSNGTGAVSVGSPNPTYTDRVMRGRLDGCAIAPKEAEQEEAEEAEEEDKEGMNGAASMPCSPPVEAEAGQLIFRKVRPDWRGNEATLSFALDVEIGGQRFETGFMPVLLRQGPPQATKALVMLLGMNASGTNVLSSQSSVDDEGNIVANVSEYDPMAFSSFKLLVMPLLPDPAPWPMLCHVVIGSGTNDESEREREREREAESK